MGKHYSMQKQMIIEALSRLGHPTAAEVHREIARTYASISLGTVYRNIGQMTEDKTVGRLMIPGEPDRFELLKKPHAHVVCGGCGLVLDAENPPKAIEAMAKNLEEATGFSIHGHSLSFSGICPDCKNKAGEDTHE